MSQNNLPPAEGDSGIERLLGNKTLGEILETAISFERAAHVFYSELTEKVAKPMRELVDSLAAEEAEHQRLLEELARHPELEEVLREHIQVPVSDHRFSDYIHAPELGDNPDDQSVLQYALGREQVAMEQYRALAEATAPGPLHDLFRFLSQEETSHKQELEKRYYDLVYR